MNGPHWIKQWINNLAVLNEQFRDEEGKVDFEALGREEYQFRMALITQNWDKSERARDTFMSTKASYDKWVENGNKGGRPPKAKEEEQRAGANSLRGGCHSAPARTCRPPMDFEEVKDFIAQNGLDYDDSRLWWQRNFVERDGIDKDGKPIKNWKGALVNACKAEETKRRSA